MIKTEIGPVTAYADAVKAGYTGTREEFARDQAEFAQNASAVAGMKQAVEQTVEGFPGVVEQAKQDVSDEGDRQVKRIADAAPDLELDRAQIEKNKKAIEGKITNPAGGTSGQVLTKTAGGEEWKDQTGGDVPTKLSDLQEDATHRTVTDTEKDTWNGKYTKPENGITSSDLAEGVIPDVSKKLTQPSTAKAGQIFRVQAINEDGTLVVEAVDMPSSDVTDVQINGTSIVGEDGVAVVPIAGHNKYGLFILRGTQYGIGVWGDGTIVSVGATEDDIKRRTTAYLHIDPKNLDYAVRAAMTDGKGPAWTADEQAMTRKRIGIEWELLVDVTTEEDVSELIYTFKDVNELIVMITGTATSNRVNFYSTGMTNFYHYSFLKANNLVTNYAHIHKRLGGMRYVECGFVSEETPDSVRSYVLIASASSGMLVRSTNDIINDLKFDINMTNILQSGARIQIFGR